MHIAHRFAEAIPIAPKLTCALPIAWLRCRSRLIGSLPRAPSPESRASATRSRTWCEASGIPSLAAMNPFCSSTAHCTASTALANSTSTPSPISLTTRPLCWTTNGDNTACRRDFNAASVPASSRSIRRNSQQHRLPKLQQGGVGFESRPCGLNTFRKPGNWDCIGTLA